MDNHSPPDWLDTLDLRLIDALVENGRSTNRELARRLDVTEATCTYRRQRLERAGVIVGYTAVIAHQYVRWSFRAWFSIRLVSASANAFTDFAQLLMSEPSVATIYATGGHADFVFEARTESYDMAYALKARLESRADLVSEMRMSPIFKQIATGSQASQIRSGSPLG